MRNTDPTNEKAIVATNKKIAYGTAIGAASTLVLLGGIIYSLIECDHIDNTYYNIFDYNISKEHPLAQLAASNQLSVTQLSQLLAQLPGLSITPTTERNVIGYLNTFGSFPYSSCKDTTLSTTAIISSKLFQRLADAIVPAGGSKGAYVGNSPQWITISVMVVAIIVCATSFLSTQLNKVTLRHLQCGSDVFQAPLLEDGTDKDSTVYEDPEQPRASP
ncbi:MAG: hypothetical protein P1U34_11760 [Coxiellaceae bacterium]|nr:hypothetical protein [Coxiellaceae bacterium]